jgi:uncharacterized protein (TIGR00725 family)
MTGVPPAGRRPIIGVMGSGVDRHDALATPLGAWIASRGFHLLTGGGGGVMAAVSRAFYEVEDRSGIVIGVVPSDGESPRCDPPPGYPNRWVELAVRTHLSLSGARGMAVLSRNHINVLTADVVVALPGGDGTASEVRLAAHYGRSCVALVANADQAAAVPEGVPCLTSVAEVAAFVDAHLGPR